MARDSGSRHDGRVLTASCREEGEETGLGWVRFREMNFRRVSGSKEAEIDSSLVSGQRQHPKSHNIGSSGSSYS